MENGVILLTYWQLHWSTCYGKQEQEKMEFHDPTKKEKRTKRPNWEETQKNCQEQEKEEDRERASIFSRNADLWWRERKECLQLGRKRGKWRNPVFQLHV